MKTIIKTGVIVVCISAFLSLFGCKAHILDGPGMVNKAQWIAFSLSRNDSYAQYNFSFTVKDNDDGAFVTGFCRDESGNEFENESGIPVPYDTIAELRSLGIDDLEDIPKTPSEETGDTEEVLLLDGGSLELSVVYYTDLVIEKVVTAELSMKVYEILLPLFAENSAENSTMFHE